MPPGQRRVGHIDAAGRRLMATIAAADYQDKANPVERPTPESRESYQRWYPAGLVETMPLMPPAAAVGAVLFYFLLPPGFLPAASLFVGSFAALLLWCLTALLCRAMGLTAADGANSGSFGQLLARRAELN